MKHLLLLALIPLTRGLPCSGTSCKNGGTCLNHSNGTFTCQCLPGYEGDLCQFVDPCTLGPCQNGGTCSLQIVRPTSPPAFTCVCPPGFTGEQCQGMVGDPCFPSPCQHGGACQRLSGNQYQCQCMSGWTGTVGKKRHACGAAPGKGKSGLVAEQEWQQIMGRPSTMQVHCHLTGHTLLQGKSCQPGPLKLLPSAGTLTGPLEQKLRHPALHSGRLLGSCSGDGAHGLPGDTPGPKRLRDPGSFSTIPG
ncbi:hypothetical protein EYD10_16956 [Varanus komodoensis]|nr:hypothetical protein EYD10_16956 [Varanus komodoensis]